uniref:J domain-containing protein n=1 Tax=Megaselia scalaris TaxID=36166 RepID=T1GVU0_MEGSC
MKSFYEILECSPNSTHEELKNSYKQLILQYHPDKNADSSIGNEIIEAWNTLRDENKRKLYDAEIFQTQIQQSYNIFGNYTVSDLSTPIPCRCSGHYLLDDEAKEDLLINPEEEILIECSECSLVIQVKS